MAKDKLIALNFLPLSESEFNFRIYRKKHQPEDKRPSREVRYYSLPELDRKQPWVKYWISFEPVAGFDEYICDSHLNSHITNEYLFQEALNYLLNNNKESILEIDSKYHQKRINILFEEHSLGTQSVWIEPFHLKTKNLFGFLIDFHYFSNTNTHQSKEELKLSLSLNRYYRSNTDFHLDKNQIIGIIINSIINKVRIPVINGTLRIEDSFQTLKSSFLKVKEYNFGDHTTNISQFNGLKDNPPYKRIKGTVQFFYVFRDDHIDLARDLVLALQGKTYHYTFPGTEQMFELKMDNKNQFRIPISNFDHQEIDRVVKEIKDRTEQTAIAIVLFPENESDFYYHLKNSLLQNNILSQAIHIDTLKNKSGLKWSISSIGLQIFSKAGGIPWRVTPSHEKCLIIGIGKAHKKDLNGNIEKFYAYSLLIDSSGEYLEMNTLANDINQDTYLNNLGENLKRVIEERSSQYKHVTLHVPYKIKSNEFQQLLKVVKNKNSQMTFTVIKINDNSKFFGYNPNSNSLIPYESSLLELSSTDYLLWPEGLSFKGRKATKKYANPLYIEFSFPKGDQLATNQKLMYLQDILNLSGASWRGFNAKSMPISIFYPKIISRFIAEFRSRNLPEIEFDKLPPWFL